jgi:hypothetical protein
MITVAETVIASTVMRTVAEAMIAHALHLRTEQLLVLCKVGHIYITVKYSFHWG